MQENNFKQFGKCMALLQETFTPEKPISKTKIELYFKLFKEWPIEKFEEACHKILLSKTISTFPLPAEIREVIEEDISTKAHLALQKLEKAVDAYGVYHSIVFDDKIIHAVVDRLGGWKWLTQQTYEEWKWIRKDFLKIYEVYSKINPSQLSIPERLIGLCEKQNSADGYDDDSWKKMIVHIEDMKQIESKKVLQIKRQEA